MALLKYFKPATPEESTLLTTKELKKIEEKVKRSREKEEAETVAKRRKIGTHNKYSPKMRASIGRYAVEKRATEQLCALVNSWE